MDEGNWNMAQAYMMRLDKLMMGINMAYIQGNIPEYKGGVDCLYFELHPKIKEIKEDNSNLDVVDKQKAIVDKLFGEWRETPPSYKHRRTKAAKKSELLKELNVLNIMLRDAVNDVQLLLPGKHDPSQAIFEGMHE